jgi:hypothetical protein
MSLMELDVNVFDAWTFRRAGPGVEYPLLHTSQEKADRLFNGGRFWQIPSHWIGGDRASSGCGAAVARRVWRRAARHPGRRVHLHDLQPALRQGCS